MTGLPKAVMVQPTWGENKSNAVHAPTTTVQVGDYR